MIRGGLIHVEKSGRPGMRGTDQMRGMHKMRGMCVRHGHVLDGKLKKTALMTVVSFVLCLGTQTISLNKVFARESGHPETVSVSKGVSGKPRERTVVFIGDSITAGYGVKKEEAFPHLIGERLRSKGHAVKVINGGVSGSVSAEADRRVRWFLKAQPDLFVLALGANDGLKGTPPDVIKKNLRQAIDLAQANRIPVLLIGIQVFSNFGPDYTKAFKDVYSELARETKVEFMPFLLEGVALQKSLNISDGKHPNAKGHQVIAENVGDRVESILEKLRPMRIDQRPGSPATGKE